MALARAPYSIGVVGWSALATSSIDPIQSDFSRHISMLRSTVRQTRKRQLTTLLVNVACISAGMLVNHVHPEYRKW